MECDRNWLVVLLLSVVTCGIYGIIVFCKISEDINTICKPFDGKITQNYLIVMILAPVTCGIYPLVWMHELCDRIGTNLKARGYQTDFNSSAFWLWCVLGSLIVVGPFIFVAKFIEATNQLAADYNARG